MIEVKRVYDPASEADGLRVLVDRLWPRGITKETASIDMWLKDLAPSTELRKWFNHDPAKWEAFKARYFQELDARPDEVARLMEQAKKGPVTLVFSARDNHHNNAIALAEYLRSKPSHGQSPE